ncbi:hypothetical protein FJZ39_04505 [Candidatus Saccharibacteria bacterium]|nr:hypothetical protein [Candidatus Saccharibacteria bacterium]
MGGIKNFEETIRIDREAFRAEATDALTKFGPHDRELAAALETEHVLTSDVLKAWIEQIEPVFNDLQSELEDARFRTLIMRRIGYDETQAELAIERMVEHRKAQLLDEVLTNLYSIDIHEEVYQRAYAEELLGRNPAEIDDFATRYGTFIEVMAAAEAHDVTLLDPHGGWLERQRAALSIHKERQKMVQDEDARLEEIDTILQMLSHSTNHIVGKIVQKDWSFVAILELRNKYQKQLDALTTKEERNPSVKLKTFDRVTVSFRENEAARLIATRKAESLQEIKAINDEVYNLLLEIFDLKTADRNQLLSDIQKYIKLSQERDLILHIQRNREHFLSIHQ